MRSKQVQSLVSKPCTNRVGVTDPWRSCCRVVLTFTCEEALPRNYQQHASDRGLSAGSTFILQPHLGFPRKGRAWPYSRSCI